MHSKLCLDPSPHAHGVGYHRPDLQDRTGAPPQANDNALFGQQAISYPKSFPGPLVLPGDDLALDPSYPPQSVQEWLRDDNRNEVTSTKKVIYVAAPPFAQANADFISAWKYPLHEAENVPCPDVQSLVN
jgi:archaemetzincin